METFFAVLAALLCRDLIRWYAAKLDWHWSVNRFWRTVPLHVQIARALSGRRPSHGDG